MYKKEGTAFNWSLLLQFSSSFLEGIADSVDPTLPFISLSKGLELNTFRMMSQIIPQALGNPRQPFIALSGPSFALELMNKLPTGYLHMSSFAYLQFVYYLKVLSIFILHSLYVLQQWLWHQKTRNLQMPLSSY